MDEDYFDQMQEAAHEADFLGREYGQEVCVSDACSAFEVAPIDLQFECTHAVYVTGGDSSLCYVTSEQRGRLIVFALNELKASGRLDEWMQNEQNAQADTRRP